MLNAKTTSAQQQKRKGSFKGSYCQNYKMLITVLHYGHFWKAVRQLNAASIEQPQDVLQDCKENLNCAYFNSQREYESNIKRKRLLESEPSIIEDDSAISDLMNSHFAEQEVMNASKDLKSKKASGLDGIPSEALKAASSVLVSHLTVL